MKNILIVEDDPYISRMLQELLRTNGYQTTSAYSGTEALLVHNAEIDLILLDLMLPGKNGEEIIKDLKRKKEVPVIVTSAISDIDTKLDLFELGAQDYVTKPFNNDELLARIKVHINSNSNVENDVINAGSIELNTKTYTVLCNQENVNLSKTEFDILALLVRNSNQVVTKSILFDSVWDSMDSADENTLNVHISKIRKKLKNVDPDKEYIETIWSIGYKFLS